MRAFVVLFWRQVVRDVRRHKLLAVLNVLSIALGTSVYLAIQISNYSADRSFAASVELIAGKADMEARGKLSDELFPELAKAPEVKAATPVVEGVATLPDFPGEYLHVLGVDVFTNEPFRTFEILDAAGTSVSMERWLSEPGVIAVTEEFANRLGLKAGSTLRLRANNEPAEVRIGFLFSTNGEADDATLRYAVMDIGWAQELLKKRGTLSSVQLLLRDPDSLEQSRAALQKRMPGDVHVGPPHQRNEQVQKMLSAFQLNLTALSLVSLLVGMFLVYNTVAASVTRRRFEIGMLRAMGASTVLVRSLFIGEALLFGAIGALVGTGAGILLSRVLVQSVAQTISSLYVLMSIDKTYVSFRDISVAAGLTLLSSVVAALLPANEAASTEPARVLAQRESASRVTLRVGRGIVAGFCALLLAGLCAIGALKVTPRLGFASAFFVLVGFSLFAPAVAKALALGLQILSPRLALWRMAGTNLQRSLPRTSITAAALSSAVAMFIGVSVMIYSFRGTVNAWINRIMQAEVYVAPLDNEITGLSSFVPDEIHEWFAHRGEVEEIDTYRQYDAQVNGTYAIVAAVSSAERRHMELIDGSGPDAYAKFAAGDGVFISEPYSWRTGARMDDVLKIETSAGIQRMPVLGVFTDFTRDQGVVLIHRDVAQRCWGDVRSHSLAIGLRKGANADQMLEEFRKGPGSGGQFMAYSNRHLKERILRIFDQTFAVTHILRTIAIFVAISGIFLSFGALVFERQRMIGVLRAIGASVAQVMRLFLIEAFGISLAACVLGMAGGSVLACVLTFVVNPAFFGWTIHLEWPWALLFTAPLWIVPTGMVAALFPAWQASRLNVGSAIRFE